MNRLYVVVRADLPRGLQLAQACHAAREFSLNYPGDAQGENLVVLEVPSEPELAELAARLPGPSVRFHEPDLGGELTAFATDGRARRLLSHLPLAGRCRLSDAA